MKEVEKLVPMSKVLGGGGWGDNSTTTMKNILMGNTYSIVVDGKHMKSLEGGRGGGGLVGKPSTQLLTCYTSP